MQRWVSYIGICVVLVAMSACGTLAQKTNQTEGQVAERHIVSVADGRAIDRGEQLDSLSLTKLMDSIENNNPQEHLPVIYYTEGIKRGNIYNDTETAIALFDKAVALDSTYTPALYTAADMLMSIEPKKALEYGWRINKMDSTEIWYKVQLGRLLVLNSEYDKAEKVYAELIKSAPGSPENYSMLAALYEHAHQPYSALGVLEQAEKVFGKVEQLSEYKREILVNLKLFDKAIDEGEELMATNPYNYKNHLALAQLYGEVRKDSLAQQSYNQALMLNPGGVDILASMIDFYKATGDNTNYLTRIKELFQKSDIPVEPKVELLDKVTSNRGLYQNHRFQIRELAMALHAMYPNNYEVLEQYTLTLIMLGELEQVAETYKRYVGTGVGGIALYHNILDVEGYLQHSDSVDKYLNIALSEYPKSAELYIRRGWTYQYDKDDKSSMKAYKTALKYAQSDSLRSVIYGVMGDLNYKMKKTKQTFSCYDKSLQYWEDNTVVLNNYAYYLSEEDLRQEDALVMAQRVVGELDQSNATYIDTYAWLLYKLGRYEDAKREMQKAVALDTQQSDVLFVHYGDILAALGDYYMATIYWRRAEEQGYDAGEIATRILSVEGK